MNLGSVCRLGRKLPGFWSRRQHILYAAPGPGMLQFCDDDPHFSDEQEGGSRQMTYVSCPWAAER